MQQLELLSSVLGQHDELEPELDNGRWQLCKLRPECGLDAIERGGGIAKRCAAPPRPAADEPCGQRELAHEPTPALGPRHQRLDERTECATQRELVADRLGKLERLDDLRRRTPAANARS